MEMIGISFCTTDWTEVTAELKPGSTGLATWRTQHFGAIRVRVVDYSAGYLADHWCRKGHILLLLEGQLEIELEDGRRLTLTPGMSYQVGDQAEAHRSSSPSGAKLFIVD